MTEGRGVGWAYVERAAREQLEAADAATQLAFGDRIAWTHCSYAKTDELSAIHRVSNPDPEKYQTFCGADIPPAVRHFPPLRSLNVCRACEIQFAESLMGLTVSA